MFVNLGRDNMGLIKDVERIADALGVLKADMNIIEKVVEDVK
jgi:hypothetical protein